nr:MAG TPA: hypothetical protein [Caudoviricetes sp.]
MCLKFECCFCSIFYLATGCINLSVLVFSYL